MEILDHDKERPRFVSRAELATIPQGHLENCRECETQIKWHPTRKPKMVACNIYDEGKWQRLEKYHPDCYADIGQPYGEPGENMPTLRTKEEIQAQVAEWEEQRSIAAQAGAAAVQEFGMPRAGEDFEAL